MRRDLARRVSGWPCVKSKRRRSGADQRALLRRVLAEHLAQRPVQEVRRRVVARAMRSRALVVDLELDRVADRDRALRRPRRGARRGRRSGFCVSLDRERARRRRAISPRVADLAARLAVERRLRRTTISTVVARAQRARRARRRSTSAHDRPRRSCSRLVAEERRRRRARCASALVDAVDRRLVRALRTRAALAAPRRARCSKPASSTSKPRSLRDHLGEVEREAVRVVELERDRRPAARSSRRALAARANSLVEQLEAALERRAEALLLARA